MKIGRMRYQSFANRYARILSMLVGAILIFLHFLIFKELFPNSGNALGHDYALFFPALLDGAYWQALNGIWETPWFTPSFCGGVPKFANPNAGFYSVPQFLTFTFSPLISVKLTLVIFAGLGYWGIYLLLRRVFHCGRSAAVLGAALFLFNGFYVYRMAIGHLTYHGFMLIPWVAYFNLNHSGVGKPYYFLRRIVQLLLAGMIVSYMVLSGMINLILPSMIAVGVIVLIKLLYENQRSNKYSISVGSISRRNYLVELIFIGILALVFSASQIMATQSFLKYFPRDFYPLPGVPNIFDILHVIFKVLFVEPDHVLAEKVRVNARWTAGRHEHELGISMVPLFVMALFLFVGVTKARLKRFQNREAILLVLAILGALLLPVIINFYTPDWNAILKKTPVIGSSSTLVRWYCLYIPIVILLTALCLDHLGGSRLKRYGLVTVSLLVILLTNNLADKAYYHKENYPPSKAVLAHDRLKAGEFIPRIDRISGSQDLTNNASNKNCYEPIFGYLKEAFPIKTLHDGSVLKNKNGVFNLKNPACYMYPEENNCEPGDHFTSEQKNQLERFRSYKPFVFAFSRAQIIANSISTVFWSVSTAVIIFGLLFLLVCKLRLKQFLWLKKSRLEE